MDRPHDYKQGLYTLVQDVENKSMKEKRDLSHAFKNFPLLIPFFFARFKLSGLKESFFSLIELI